MSTKLYDKNTKVSFARRWTTIDNAPAAHDVRLTREDFRQAAHDDIRVFQDIDVDEIANSLIHDDREVEFVGQASKFLEVRRT